ncbi:MAG: FkbM family methyltransferase [Verrucomicrobiota bacterium]|nr:FkbM family methyltransferase [Verrucomicrobiota bacterium]
MIAQSTFGRWRSFLYRRLASIITCEIKLLGNHPLALDNKYQVNSLQDVFCHPYYWQLYNWFEQPPRLIVDLGAHCAHFSMLAEVCFRVQFGEGEREYLLVEPNPDLIPVIQRNLARSGLCPNHQLKQGLVGKREGTDSLWVCSSNYLSASLQQGPSTRSVSAEYFDLEKLIGNRPVDLLKIDIEGAEYELVANYPKLFERVEKLIIEIHTAPDTQIKQMLSTFERAGLQPYGKALEHAGYQLAMFERR